MTNPKNESIIKVNKNYVNLICKYISDIGGSIHYDNLMCLICGWVERDNGNRSKLSERSTAEVKTYSQ